MVYLSISYRTVYPIDSNVKEKRPLKTNERDSKRESCHNMRDRDDSFNKGNQSPFSNQRNSSTKSRQPDGNKHNSYCAKSSNPLLDHQHFSKTPSVISKRESSTNQRSNPRLIPFNKQINEAARNNDSEECKRILKEIEKADLRPDAYSYTPIINIFVRKQDQKKAYAVFAEMKTKGVPPNEVTYTSLINLFVKKEDVTGAYAVFDEMKANGALPNEVTYTSLINLFVKKEDETGAYAVFEEMKAKGMSPNEVTYNSLINLFVKKEDVKGAYAVFEEMKTKEVLPDEVTYQSLIDLLVKLDYLEQVEVLFASKFSIKKHMSQASLDLHGLSHGTAFVALSIFIKSYWENDSFLLITGKGLHSKSKDFYQMRDFMMKKIKEKIPHVECQVDPENGGSLIIKRKKIIGI